MEDRKAYKRRYYAEHRDKLREQQKARDILYRTTHQKEYHLKHREWKLKRKYELDLGEYKLLSEQQHNMCAICGHPNQGSRPLCVDHDHNTGKVRGLLCHRCNRLLGWTLDDTENFDRWIISARAYLELPSLCSKNPNLNF